MMKKLYILLILGIILSSCEDFDFADQGFDLEALPGYVAFGNAGGTIVAPVLTASETGGVRSFRIECPTGNDNAITVSFSFSGTAIYGTDYAVPSSTAAGGSIVLPNTISDPNDYNFVNLPITILTDGVPDGTKQLIITLTGAVDATGKQFVVGRNEYMKVATLNITNVD